MYTYMYMRHKCERLLFPNLDSPGNLGQSVPESSIDDCNDPATSPVLAFGHEFQCHGFPSDRLWSRVPVSRDPSVIAFVTGSSVTAFRSSDGRFEPSEGVKGLSEGVKGLSSYRDPSVLFQCV